MIRRLVASLALVLAVLLVASCGSGAPPRRTTATPTGTTSSPAATGTAPAVDRPNVMVIETDDMRWDELEFMPNVRKLIADRGLTFENSFAPYPLCCPSRASFLSGKYAHNHKVLGTSSPFGFQSFDDRTTLATVLHKGGYATGLVGKYLNGYAAQHVHGSSQSSLHYVPPGWDQWMAGSDHVFSKQSPYKGGTYQYFRMTQIVNGTITPHPGIYSSVLLGRQTRGLVRKFGDAGKPWFVWWTPVAPHFGGPKEADDPRPVRNDKGTLQKFPTPGRPDWVKGRFDQTITHPLGTPAYGPAEADNSDKPRFLRRFPEMNDAERTALTEVSRQRAEALYALDRQIGRTLTTLRRTGQYDRTVIAFTSDNGYFLGEHRKRQGKILNHEPSLRVPLLIAGPGVPHGRRYDPVTTIDMAPTIATYAGLTMPDTDGEALQPLIEDGDRGWDTPVVTEGQMGNSGYLGNYTHKGFDTALNTKGIRTARWKYTKYSSGEVELYDLKNDPLELQSLQADPSYDAVRRKLDQLWFEYDDCKGSGCTKPLPAEFRTTAAEERSITDAEIRRTRAYYTDPGAQR